MTLRRITTGTITATGTTYTSKLSALQNQEPFAGKVEKIAFVVSASTDFKVYTLQSDGESAEEYLLGTSGAYVTVAADKVFHPRVLEQLASDGSNLTTHTAPIVYGDIYIDVSNLTAADTFEIIFFISDR